MKLRKDKATTENTSNAIIGSAQRPRKKLNKKALVFAAIAVLVIAGSVTALLFFKENNQSSSVQEEENAVKVDDSKPSTSNIDTLTEEQLRTAAAANVDPKTDLEATRTKAAALAQLNDYQGAIVVYDQITVSGAGNYEDTANYAFVVLASGDYQKAIDLLKKATQELSQSSADGELKKTRAEYYANKIRILEREKAELQ